MTEIKGTKELKELLDLALAGVEVGVKISADKKVDITDLGHLLILVPKVEPAFAGVGEVPSELADLSTEEAAEVVTHVMAKLMIEDAKAKLVVEKALKALVANYELVKAVKAA